MSNTYSAGIATAYGAAVRGGYTGTYDEWCALMADYATVGEQAAQSAQAAQASAENAATSESNAADSAGEAAAQATAAATSAANAGESATDAAGSASAASTSATNAADSATAAAGSASAAAESATNAAASEAAARAVEESIPADYSALSNDVANMQKALFDDKALVFEIGGIVSGNPSPSTRYCRTVDFIPVRNGAKLKINNQAAFALSVMSVYYYSEADASSYISANTIPSVPVGQSAEVALTQTGYFKLRVAQPDAATDMTAGDLAAINQSYTVAEFYLADEVAELQEDVDGLSEGYADLSADVSDLKSHSPSIATPEETEADLYICDSDGNVIAKFQDGNFETKNFDTRAIRLAIMEADSDAADLYIADSFGNIVAEFKDGGIVTKNFNSADFADVLPDISDLLSAVSALVTKTSGVLYRQKDTIDGIYAACRWHQPNATSKQFCLLISGDIHGDAIRLSSVIEALNEIDAFDAGIMLGDMSEGTSASNMAYYYNAIARTQKPWLTVIGNHDVYGITTNAELYARYMAPCIEYADLASGELVEGKCYYHKDFADYKIRLIVLMQYEMFDGNLCFLQDQINWFIGVLNSTPSDYAVIIAEHTNPSRYLTYNMDEAYTSSTWSRYNYAPTDMDGNPIPDIVNAWINGTAINATYSYTTDNPPTALSVSADFASRGAGEFITYIGGHWHMDVLGHPTDYVNQPDYHVPATSITAGVQGDIPRRAGTLSEDLFCALAVDRVDKTVKIFHVGGFRTKDAIVRQYFKYAYGGVFNE